MWLLDKEVSGLNTKLIDSCLFLFLLHEHVSFGFLVLTSGLTSMHLYRGGQNTENARQSFSTKKQNKKKLKRWNSALHYCAKSFNLCRPTCRLLWHIGLKVAVRWLCMHFPKCCRQEELVWLQVWGHDGGFSSKQLEQEVCWQEPWHAVFFSDTNLWSRK